MNHLYFILKGNWNELKGTIKNKWGALTDKDLEKIDGSYDELVGKLQKLYGYTSKEIEAEVNEFLESIDFKSLIDETKNKIQKIQEIVWTTLKDSLQTIKKKSMDTEKIVADYAQNNPMKLIGFATATGLIVSYLCHSKKN